MILVLRVHGDDYFDRPEYAAVEITKECRAKILSRSEIYRDIDEKDDIVELEFSDTSGIAAFKGSVELEFKDEDGEQLFEDNGYAVLTKMPDKTKAVPLDWVLMCLLEDSFYWQLYDDHAGVLSTESVPYSFLE